MLNFKNLKIFISLLIFFIFFEFSKESITGQSFQNLEYPKEYQGNEFGNSVSCSNSLGIVGFQFASNNMGAAFVYELDQNGFWQASDLQNITEGVVLQEGDFFGTSVDIFSNSQGDHCIVGAKSFSNSGSVYYFSRKKNEKWVMKEKILSPETANGDSFGQTVALYEETYLIIGAPKVGKAFIYERNKQEEKWELKEGITQSSISAFGCSVSISQDLAIIGANGNGAYVKGSAFSYKRNGDGSWSFISYVRPLGLEEGDLYGSGVSIFDYWAIVSSKYAAYIFKYDDTGSSWVLENRIDPPSPYYFLSENQGVSINSKYAAIGSINENKVYLYQLTNGVWNFSQVVQNQDSFSYGNSVNMDDEANYVIVGAPGNGVNVEGKAFIYGHCSEDIPCKNGGHKSFLCNKCYGCVDLNCENGETNDDCSECICTNLWMNSNCSSCGLDCKGGSFANEECSNCICADNQQLILGNCQNSSLLTGGIIFLSIFIGFIIIFGLVIVAMIIIFMVSRLINANKKEQSTKVDMKETKA